MKPTTTAWVATVFLCCSVTATTFGAPRRVVKPVARQAKIIARVGAMTLQAPKEDRALQEIAAGKITPMSFRQVETRLRSLVPVAEFQAAQAAGEMNASSDATSPSPTTQPFQTEEGVTLRPWTSSRVVHNGKVLACLWRFSIRAAGYQEADTPELQIAQQYAKIEGGSELVGRFHPMREVGASMASKTFVLKIEAEGLPSTRVVVNGRSIPLNKITEGVYACMFTTTTDFDVSLPLQGADRIKFRSMAVKRFTY